ncbi:LytTR family DNA-binding domain-containing protein [Thalassotalea sp. G2M2-11]|uniref:LytR/AlgR family response regulator transcription factor n=1 Tax=Thalassotalea sp. G2M2-11 TaxID=2787627 RepID=UPI0019D2CFBD|nr:LytTR family DNA-binding domain-containing protein [Thalassotalea sp. G2M2-11]
MFPSASQILSATKGKLWPISIVTVLAIIALGIFQDYLHSQRNGISFFFSESLLFKSLWVIFPPILLLLKRELQKQTINSPSRMVIALVVATLAHLILVPSTIWSLSTIFREQSYGFYKVLTYTLANDLLKIIVIYGAFIVLFKYFANNQKASPLASERHSQPQDSISDFITVNSGKNNHIIKLADIIYIQSATPYVTIQTAQRQHLHSATLKSIMQDLDARFIRIHRSMIVNLDKVLSYQSRLNGDYDLTLQDGSEVRLSRNFVKEFKAEFKSTHQLKR